MPFYQIHHACPLSLSQKDELAEAITRIHSTKFTTPKLFINVSFHDSSSSSDTTYYVAGKRRAGNHILATVRSGPSRTQEDYNSLCLEIEKAWKEIAGTPLPQPKGREYPDTTLRMVQVRGGILAGLEAGFIRPQAGGDVQWLKDNMAAFEAKAEAGDEDFQGLVQDVRERGLLGEGDGLKTAQQRLEEMMGWGEYA